MRELEAALGRDGAIYFGSWDKNFYALNPDGTLRWHFQTAGEIVSSPTIGAGGMIYFGSHDGKLYAVAADGTKQWQFPTGGPILSSPAINGEQCLYFTSVEGNFYAVNLDGRLRWRLRTGGITESSPVIGPNGTIYVAVNDRLWAITPEGKKKWERLGDGPPIESSAVVFADGSVCFASPWTLVSFFPDDANLAIKWTFYHAGSGSASPAVAPSGMLYTPSHLAGNAFCAIRAGEPLAHSPWPKFRGNPRNTGNLADLPGH
jgi:outer membrane protein assembly factor BamB